MKETTSSSERRHVKHRRRGAGRHKSDFSSSPPSFRLQYLQEFLNSGHLHIYASNKIVHRDFTSRPTYRTPWHVNDCSRLPEGYSPSKEGKRRGEGKDKERSAASQIRHFFSQISSAIFLSQSFLFTWDFSFFLFFPPLLFFLPGKHRKQ